MSIKILKKQYLIFKKFIYMHIIYVSFCETVANTP